MKQIFASSAGSRVLAVVALAAVLAACGRGEEQEAVTPVPSSATAEGGATGAAPVETPEDKRLANAVPTGKTAAPVDLKYDVLAKPQVGQPFEIELALLPRLAADALEVEVTGIPGLAIVSGGVAKFEDVSSGERHVARVLVQADAAGIFYANVVARMITQSRSEVRTFSVPVVVGNVAAVQKAEPAKDATGEAIQSMPAVESGGPAEPGKQ
jgi:hypothetical protein